MPPSPPKPNVFDILPTEAIRLILRFATSCDLAFSTSPSSILLGQIDATNRYRHFGAYIISSLPTKVALSLVSRRMAEINEEYLLEAIMVSSYDLLPGLARVLSSPSRSDKEKVKGSLVKRLDFRLGRDGRYWSGEGQEKGFRNLYRLLPHLTSLSLLFIDPYVTKYISKNHGPLKLPKAFWKVLTDACGGTLRLLSVKNTQVYSGDLLRAAGALQNLESLELQGGWFGGIPSIPPETPKIPMRRLHHLHINYIESLPGFTYPALQNAFISFNILLVDHETFGWQLGRRTLTRLTYCGPGPDLFKLGVQFPNLQHLEVHKLRNSHFTHSWWAVNTNMNGLAGNINGNDEEESDPESVDETSTLVPSPTVGAIDTDRLKINRNTMSIIYSLRSITICHYHLWPFGRSIIDNILELREQHALPELEEVKYVEHDGWVRREGNVDEVDNVLKGIGESFERAGVRFVAERRCLSLD